REAERAWGRGRARVLSEAAGALAGFVETLRAAATRLFEPQPLLALAGAGAVALGAVLLVAPAVLHGPGTFTPRSVTVARDAGAEAFALSVFCVSKGADGPSVRELDPERPAQAVCARGS